MLHTLEAVHPNLYFKASRKDISDLRRELEASITQPMTRVEFWPLAGRLAAAFGDDHTSVWPPGEDLSAYAKSGGLFFPLLITEG